MMKHWIKYSAAILFALCLLPSTTQAQVPMAKFYADTQRLEEDERSSGGRDTKMRTMTWRIHGQDLHFGSDTLTIPVDDVIDTIFYLRQAGEDWDTLICSISQPGLYLFGYNECCGAFNVMDPITRHNIVGQVQYQLQSLPRRSKSKPEKSRYVGTIGEAGLVIDPKQPTAIAPACHSAVVPNIYEIHLYEIGPCKTDTCDMTICQFEAGVDTLNYDFQFDILRDCMHFYYLPLRAEPLAVLYDCRRGTWKMQ